MLKKLSSIFTAFILIISAIPFTASAKVTNEDIVRYSVLVLDSSGSMSGQPLTAMKDAATLFCESVMEDHGKNYVAVVSYSSYANCICDFTTDLDTLENSIKSIYASGDTNVQGALYLADTKLAEVKDASAIKNIVLLSDGVPCAGTAEYDGRYNSSDFYYYYNANSAYSEAKRSWSAGNYVYTLGFFHSLSGSSLEFGQRFLNDLQNAGYYDVTDPETLKFTFGQIAGAITKVTGEFSYPGTDDVTEASADYSSDFYYDDSYFLDSAYTYNPHLSTMSLCLELSVWPSTYVGNNYADSKTSINAQNLFNDIGFVDFETNPKYSQTPESNSIGVGVAHKKLTIGNEDITIIAVAVRGGGYKKEWEGNFNVGASGEHTGFALAKDQVLDFIRTYINSHDDITGKIKFWVTGYSRGAATANLTAAALDNGISYSGCSYSAGDVYAYTFETPAGAMSPGCRNSLYNNIFNIINPNDVVPKVAPQAWQFGRYGKDMILPSNVGRRLSGYQVDLNTENKPYSTLEANMLDMYDALGNKSRDGYVVDDFSEKTIDIEINPTRFLPGGEPLIDIQIVDTGTPQGTFLQTFMDKFADIYVGSRTNYAYGYQDYITYIVGTVFGATGSQKAAFGASFKNKFSGDNLKPTLLALLEPYKHLFKSAQEKEMELYDNFADLLADCCDDAGIDYGSRSQLREAAESVLDLVMATGLNELGTVINMAINLDSVGNAHHPELCLAWLQSFDSYYTDSSARSEFSTGLYRVIRINCPVDVTVYDANNNPVAFVSSKNTSDIVNDVVCGIDESGEKVVYLPVDEDFKVDISAYDEGDVHVTVDEYSQLRLGAVKTVAFNKKAVKSGDVLTGVLPAYTADDIENYENGSSVKYTLTDTEGNDVEINTELTGQDAAEAYYKVSLSSDYENRGFLKGAGAYKFGSFAEISASAYDGCTFDGWYDADNKLVSSDPVYRFEVTEDAALTAHFSAATHTVTAVASATDGAKGGKVEGIDDKYSVGTIFTAKAVADEGYQFVKWEVDGIVVENAESAETKFFVADADAKITAVFEPIPVETSSEATTSETTTSTTSTTSETTTSTTVSSSENNASAPRTGVDGPIASEVILFSAMLLLGAAFVTKKKNIL